MTSPLFLLAALAPAEAVTAPAVVADPALFGAALLAAMQPIASVARQPVVPVTTVADPAPAHGDDAETSSTSPDKMVQPASSADQAGALPPGTVAKAPPVTLGALLTPAVHVAIRVRDDPAAVNRGRRHSDRPATQQLKSLSVAAQPTILSEPEQPTAMIAALPPEVNADAAPLESAPPMRTIPAATIAATPGAVAPTSTMMAPDAVPHPVDPTAPAAVGQDTIGRPTSVQADALPEMTHPPVGARLTAAAGEPAATRGSDTVRVVPAADGGPREPPVHVTFQTAGQPTPPRPALLQHDERASVPAVAIAPSSARGLQAIPLTSVAPATANERPRRPPDDMRRIRRDDVPSQTIMPAPAPESIQAVPFLPVATAGTNERRTIVDHDPADPVAAPATADSARDQSLAVSLAVMAASALPVAAPAVELAEGRPGSAGAAPARTGRAVAAAADVAGEGMLPVVTNTPAADLTEAAPRGSLAAAFAHALAALLGDGEIVDVKVMRGRPETGGDKREPPTVTSGRSIPSPLAVTPSADQVGPSLRAVPGDQMDAVPSKIAVPLKSRDQGRAAQSAGEAGGDTVVLPSTEAASRRAPPIGPAAPHLSPLPMPLAGESPVLNEPLAHAAAPKLPSDRQELPDALSRLQSEADTRSGGPSASSDAPSDARTASSSTLGGQVERNGESPLRIHPPDSSEARNLPGRGRNREVPAGLADRVTLQFTDADGRPTRIRVAVLGEQIRAVILPPDNETGRQLERRMDDLHAALVRQGFVDPRVSVQQAATSEAAVGWVPATRVEVPVPRGAEQPAGDQRQGSGRREQQQGDQQRHPQGRSRNRDPEPNEREEAP